MSLAKARFVHVEVFTDTPGSGNPAGVVIAAAPIDDEAQRRWAETMRHPGNGFLWPAGDGAYHARFHTPGREVGLSGHTALACAHALLTTLEPSAEQVVLRSRTTDLPVARRAGALWLTLVTPHLEPLAAPLPAIATALGLEPDAAFRAEIPVMQSSDGDLLLPLAEDVDPVALTPNFDALAAIGNGLGTRGFFVYSISVHADDADVQSRFFAPHIGLPEDVATGSVHAPLAAYLWRLGLTRGSGPMVEVVGEQGAALGRPCRVRVELAIQGGSVARVSVGGAVVTVDESPAELARAPG
jgi:PhzF family phenazine biosynthesis protein